MKRMPSARPIAAQFRNRPQTASVARDLKRLIHSVGLRSGDRLPTQEQLRETHGFHNNTLNAAMDILMKCGVLTRKRKVGTVVADPHSPVPSLWRVGVTVVPAASEQTYYAQLLHFMQVHLQAAGAEISLFMQQTQMPDPHTSPALSDFNQLPEACAGGSLDGLLLSERISGENWGKWHKQRLELTHAGAWEDAPAGVVIDQRPMVEDAVARLASAGCRRLGIVSMYGPQPGFCWFWDSFRTAVNASGLGESNIVSLHGGDGLHGGWRVAQHLLEMPSRMRPDGLIVIDDRIASGLTAVLAGANGEYRPRIAVQTNRQAPLAYALPVIHYEVDVDELARRAVANLMARLLNPATELQREYLSPKLRSRTPRYMELPQQLQLVSP